MTFINYLIKLIRACSKTYLFLFLCVICLILFKTREYTIPLPAKKWIQSNLDKIAIKDPESFSFAVFSGEKINLTVFDNLLKQVDYDPDIAFVFDLGDTVLKGSKIYYQSFINEINNNLGIPVLTLMGDNELSGGGKELYHEIFGPLYYSFKLGNNYFIALDDISDNGLGHRQMEWLENELKESRDYGNRIIFLHRPLYDSLQNSEHSLPEEISSHFIELCRKYRVSHIFASQDRGYYEGDLEGIRYTNTGGAGPAFDSADGDHSIFHFLKVNFEKDYIDVEIKKVFSPGFDQMGPIRYRLTAYADNMIRFHWAELTVLLIILLICAFNIVRNRKKDSGFE